MDVYKAKTKLKSELLKNENFKLHGIKAKKLAKKDVICIYTCEENTVDIPNMYEGYPVFVYKTRRPLQKL